MATANERTQLTGASNQNPKYLEQDSHQQPPGYAQPPPYQQAPGYWQPGHWQQGAIQQPVQGQPIGNNQRYAPMPYVPDNMVLSYFSIFFCFLIGIFAVVKSSEARDYKRRGEFDKARASANTAKKLAIASIVVSFVFIVLVVLFAVLFPLVITGTSI